MRTIEIECPSCRGTGVYVGMGEGGGAAVVCYVCKGTGHTTYSYKPFTGRKHRDDVKRVYPSGCGYKICADDITTEDGTTIHFSKYGADYDSWFYDGVQPRPIEELTCPYIYDRTDIDKCSKFPLGFKLDNCPRYDNKDKCWKIYWEEKGGVE